MSQRDNPEVLVVGAGPAGLTAAHELVRHGIAVRLIDAAARPAVTSRAIATHPRTLELYRTMGVADEMVRNGARVTAFTLFQDGRRLTRLEADYTQMPTRYPFTLCIDQVRTEQVLRDALRRRDVEIEWGTRLVELVQDNEAVHATLATDDGTETVTVPYLVGADGGHSVVRGQLGLRLVGESAETWLIADATMQVPVPRDSIYWVRNRGVAMMLAPMSGTNRWRLLDTVHTGRREPEAVAERFSIALAAGLGGPVRIDRPEWLSVFTFQQRMIPQMRVGRCFVTGDAAHVHSPASGQGMNTGIQEAYNLAWKLAMVQRGQAADRLLDTYSAERVPVGRSLLRSTRKATYLVQLKNPVIGGLLPALFGVVRAVPAIRRTMQRHILGGISGLNLSYLDSTLTVPCGGRPLAGPQPGERITALPDPVTDTPQWARLCRDLCDGRWLLVVSGEATSAESRAVRQDWLALRHLVTALPTEGCTDDERLADPDRTVRTALGLNDCGWLLVRPDGYVCARGTDMDRSTLAAALSTAGIGLDVADDRTT